MSKSYREFEVTQVDNGYIVKTDDFVPDALFAISRVCTTKKQLREMLEKWLEKQELPNE